MQGLLCVCHSLNTSSERSSKLFALTFFIFRYSLYVCTRSWTNLVIKKKAKQNHQDNKLMHICRNVILIQIFILFSVRNGSVILTHYLVNASNYFIASYYFCYCFSNCNYYEVESLLLTESEYTHRQTLHHRSCCDVFHSPVTDLPFDVAGE